MSTSSAPVLVTGGTGFLGAHLLESLLAKGIPVRAIRRKNSRMDLVKDLESKVEWVEADVSDIFSLENALRGVEMVYHCAAVVSFHPKDRNRMFKANVEGTANLVNAALDAGARRLVHVSSIAALGRDPKRIHLGPESKWVESPQNSQYAVSKYQAELEAWRGQAEGLEVQVVLPAMVLGAGFWEENTAKFFSQVNAGLKFWPLGTSGFVDVRDVAEFMILLMHSKESGARYLLSAENMTYKALFDTIAEKIGRKPPSIKVTPFLAEVAWRVEWLKEKITGMTPMVTKESARASLNNFLYDGTKAENDFDFSYRPVQSTLSEMGDLFLQSKGTPCRMRHK